MSVSMTQNQVILNRAKSAVLARDYDLAVRLYKGLLKSDPKNISLLKDVGNLYVKSGNDKDAVFYFKEVIRLKKDDVDSLNALGGTYRRLKMYDESIKVLEEAVIADENNMQTFYNLGFTYKVMEKYDYALHCFNTVVENNPNDVLAYNHIGSIYALKNQHNQAISSYQRGLKVDLNHPVLHLNLAKSFEAIGNLDSAAKEYEAALRTKIGWVDAISGYADLLLKRNHSGAAGELIKSAINLNPNNAYMHTKMGEVYSQQCVYDDAEKEFGKAIEIEPKNKKALSGLAKTYESTGRNVEALSTIEKAQEIDPDDYGVGKDFAHILLTANKLAEAKDKIKKIYDANPDDVQTLNLLGQYYICSGNENKALGCFKKIKAIDPNYNAFYRDGAKRYTQKGDYSKAQQYFDRYNEKVPNDRIALAWTGENYEKQNEYEKALDAYKKIGEIDPCNEYSRNAVDRVQNRLNLKNQDQQDLTQGEFDQADDNLFDDDFYSPSEKIETGVDEFGFDAGNGEKISEENFQEQLDALDDTPADSGYDFETLAQNDESGGSPFDVDKLEQEIQADNQDKYAADLDSLVPEEEALDNLDQDDENDFFASNPFGSSGGFSNGPKEDDMEMDFTPDDIGSSKNDDLADQDFIDDFDFEPEPERAHQDSMVPQQGNPSLNDGIDSGNNSGSNSGNRRGMPFSNSPSMDNADMAPRKPQAKANDDSIFSSGDPNTDFSEDSYDNGITGENEESSLSNAVDDSSDKSEPYTGYAPSENLEPIEDADESGSEKFDDFENTFDDDLEGMDNLWGNKDNPPEEEESEMEVSDGASSENDFSNDSSSESSPLTDDDLIFNPQTEEESLDDDLDHTSCPQENSSFDEDMNYASQPQDDSLADDSNLNSDENVCEAIDQESQSIIQEESDSSGTEYLSEPSMDDVTQTISEAVTQMDEIISGLSDKEIQEKYSSAKELFKKLKGLIQFLPEQKKKDFLESRNYLMLEYIIARLDGKPGLLAAATELRKVMDIRDGSEPVVTGRALLLEVLENLRVLTESLPDKAIGNQSYTEITSLIEKLK